ncbi:MAG: hypothetical protein IKQ50_06375 [Paludibacteraceae bacterium]|nr:hypothetical protein [Paludibacteraceae bacterium]
MKKTCIIMLVAFVSLFSMNAFGKAKQQFSNENYVFSYDSKFDVQEQSSGMLLVHPKNNSDSKTYLLLYAIKMPIADLFTDTATINIALRAACTTFMEKGRSGYADMTINEPEITTHNGQPACVATYTAKGSNGAKFYGQVLYVLTKSSMCGGAIQAENEKDYKLLCEVLSTTEFKENAGSSDLDLSSQSTDAAAAADLTKQYRKNRFSFMYPENMTLSETEDEDNGLQIVGVFSKGTGILNFNVQSNPLFALLDKDDVSETLIAAAQEMGPKIKQLYTSAVVSEPMEDNSIAYPNVYITFSGKLVGKSMQGKGRIIVMKSYYIVIIAQADSPSLMATLDAIYKSIRVD